MSPGRRIILVGGVPLSGKTTIARRMGERLGLPVISTDLLGEAVRAVTTPDSHPDLHACSGDDYRSYFAAHEPAILLEHALRAHRALWPAIEAVIRRRIEWEGAAIIEGWALLPDLVSNSGIPGLKVLYVDVSQSVLMTRLRTSGFADGADGPELVKERFVSRSVLMSDWLRERSAACSFPFVVVSGSESPDEAANRCFDVLKMITTGAK